jgi:hypothetical protein
MEAKLKGLETDCCPVADDCVVCEGRDGLQVELFGGFSLVCLTRCEYCRERGDLPRLNLVEEVALGNQHVGHVERARAVR